MSSQPPSDTRELARLLESVSAPMSVSEVLGTLTALTTAPSPVHPSQWLLTLLGDERFTDEDDARAFLELLLNTYRSIDTHLQQDESVGPPDDEPDAVAKWCAGYFRAARQDPIWSKDTQAMRRLLPMALLSGELDRVGDAGAVMHSDAMRTKWTRDLPKLAAAFYAHWQTQRDDNRTASPPDPAESEPEAQSESESESTPFRRTEPKVSRNSACSCGSGKKRKHCCDRG